MHTHDHRTIQFRDVCAAGRLNLPFVPELKRVAAALPPCLFLTPIDCYWEGSILQDLHPPVPPVNTSVCKGENNPSGVNSTNVKWRNLNVSLLLECLKKSPESGYSPFVDQVCFQHNYLILCLCHLH